MIINQRKGLTVSEWKAACRPDDWLNGSPSPLMRMHGGANHPYGVFAEIEVVPLVRMGRYGIDVTVAQAPLSLVWFSAFEARIKRRGFGALPSCYAPEAYTSRAYALYAGAMEAAAYLLRRPETDWQHLSDEFTSAVARLRADAKIGPEPTPKPARKPAPRSGRRWRQLDFFIEEA